MDEFDEVADHLAEMASDSRSDWRSQAACVSLEWTIFFPERGGSIRPAREVCGSCPVQTECLEFAITTNQKYGVWGGKTENERRAIRKRRRLADKGDD